MKKLTIALILFLTSNLLNAQELYQTYTNGKIEVVIKDGSLQGNLYLHIDDVGIILTQLDRAKFLDFINNSYLKYIEWSDLAKKNEITKMSKVIETATFKSFFKYSGWKLSNVKISAMISIENGTPQYFLFLPAMQDSNNQYIKSSPQVLLLDLNVMSELTTYIDEEKISEFIKLKNTQENLFK